MAALFDATITGDRVLSQELIDKIIIDSIHNSGFGVNCVPTWRARLGIHRGRTRYQAITTSAPNAL
jgi:hypothetical protein